MVNFGSHNFGPHNFGIEYKKAEEIAKTDKENKIEQILEIVKRLETKLNRQNEFLNKIVTLVSKMFQDGEINKDTFNKLDEFLKPYYDNPYNG